MPGKKIGEVFVKDGKLYINSTASAQPLEVNANKVKGHTKVECFEAYTAIKKALAEVLSYQTENESDEGLKPLLDKLNKAYDDFVSTYGHFNKNTMMWTMPMYSLLKSLRKRQMKKETGYRNLKRPMYSANVSLKKIKNPPRPMSRTVSLQVSSNSVVWTYHISPNNLAQASKMWRKKSSRAVTVSRTL